MKKSKRSKSHVAARIASKIRCNIDAWYAVKINHATFHARQIELWKEASTAGVVGQVVELVAPKAGAPT